MCRYCSERCRRVAKGGGSGGGGEGEAGLVEESWVAGSSGKHMCSPSCHLIGNKYLDTTIYSTYMWPNNMFEGEMILALNHWVVHEVKAGRSKMSLLGHKCIYFRSWAEPLPTWQASIHAKRLFFFFVDVYIWQNKFWSFRILLTRHDSNFIHGLHRPQLLHSYSWGRNLSQLYKEAKSSKI